MKTVSFPMYFEVCGIQTITLPDTVDASDEDAVREYIDLAWDYIKLPTEYEYVCDHGFDFDSPIEIKEVV